MTGEDRDAAVAALLEEVRVVMDGAELLARAEAILDAAEADHLAGQAAAVMAAVSGLRQQLQTVAQARLDRGKQPLTRSNTQAVEAVLADLSELYDTLSEGADP